MTQSARSAIFSLAFVLFIDTLGLAVLFPLLNPLFMEGNHSILPLTTSFEARHLYYGVALALYPLMMFFSAPVLGDLSDHTGRKKVLIISLAGTTVSYALMAFSVPLKSMALFLLGRLFGGLTAGSQPIAQAALIDVSHPDKKAHNLSIMMGAMSLGWIVGPLLAGFFADSRLITWFNPAVALAFAGLLSLLNLFVLQFSFFETLKEKKRLEKLHLHKGPTEFVLAFTNKKLQFLSIVYLIMQLGWSFYFGFVSLFLAEHLELSVSQIGIFFAFMAVGFAIPSLGLIKKMNSLFSLENGSTLTLGMAGITALITCLVSKDIYILWPVGILFGVSLGCSLSFLLTLFSNKVTLAEQGRVMGITSSIGALTWVVSAVLGGFMANLFSCFPLLVGGILLILSSLLMFMYNTKTSK